MKIVMTTSDFFDTGHGGVESHILGLTRALTDGQAADDVTIVRTAARDVATDYEGSTDGVRYLVMPSISSRSRSVAKLLRLPGGPGLIMEFGRRVFRGWLSSRRVGEFLSAIPDITLVHQHDFLESWGLGRALARRGYTVGWTNHLGEFLYILALPGGARLLRYLTRHYAFAIAPSTELANADAISPKVHMIPNGVDSSRYRGCLDGERELLRRRFGWPQGKRIVIIPRRWAPTKGVVYAAEAMTMLEWPSDTFVCFVGSGTTEYPGYGQQIHAFLAHSMAPYEVHERVSPAVMAEMLRAADYCLIPSVKEATSLSALEAMASGVVVVAANTGGLPEIVSDGVTGYLHVPLSPHSIVSVLQRAISSNSEEITKTAAEMVERDYSWISVARQTRALYEAAL